MRKFLMVLLGLFFLVGSGSAALYAMPGGSSTPSPKVSFTQTRNLSNTQLAQAACFDKYGDEVYCYSTPPVDESTIDPYYDGPLYDAMGNPLDEGGSRLDGGPPYVSQDVPLVNRYGDLVDPSGVPIDYWGVPMYDSPPYYDGPLYDAMGNPLDEGGSRIDGGPVYVGPEEPLTNQWGELVDPRGVPIDDWGLPVDGVLLNAWGDPIDDGIYLYDDVDYDWGYEYEVVEYQEASQPWYVRAFPGIGSIIQNIIPGRQTTRIVTQTQPVQQRVAYPQPSCWISAEPTTVASRGSSVLNWWSFNASRASLTGFGEVSVTGSRTVPNITSAQTFTLSVAGQGGNGSCYTRISVQPPVSGLPSCIISANPDVITRGQFANIAWGSQNASSASLSGVGTVSTQGGISVSPIQTTTYTLTVAGSSGKSNSCTARVLVR